MKNKVHPILKRPRSLNQAFQQTPWRRQLQFVGLFAATLLFFATIAIVYLNITARASTYGRLIQEIQRERQELQQEIENMETELGYLRGTRTMAARAEELGFSPLPREQALYITVPSYNGKPTANLAPPPHSMIPEVYFLPPEFTLSLIDWARDMFQQFALQTGVSPEEVTK